ncbi:unnamed protein product [Porites evermanni]|uniref:EGF-like domain-containing protein n=1 Tax=Porites evermanni TaxID=104178 RepID=A0ABN8MJF7_9CNID|nr:unnamed protein product [Porites evermanni]
MLLFAVLALWINHAASEEIRAGEHMELYTKNFHELPGAEIELRGAFKFCKPVYCPTCIRVMYLKFGESSTCLAKKIPVKLWNCWRYKFSAKMKVPMKDGIYKITAYSLLEYKCGTIPDNAKGVVLGSIQVGNPLYWIEGRNTFTAQQGGTISVKGCYKYCKENIYCPRCIRQVYFHAKGGASVCAAHINAGYDLLCKPICVKKDIKVSKTPGKYSIRVYELLEYKCRANDYKGGVRVGTVEVTAFSHLLPTDINECAKGNPCKNGGTCVNNVGSYKCTCRKEFSGKHCETDVDECAKNPCKNGGSCKNSFGGYSCTCASGWLGKNCDTDVNECTKKPCKNGGKCTNTNGGYTCACAEGWKGTICDQDINECADNTALCNSGKCVNLLGTYKCNCPSGFKGKNCEIDIDECLNIPCKNGATCNNKPGSYSCSCSAGWTGKDCDEDIDECLNIPCKNGATCNNKPGSYSCSCSAGWTGKDCDEDINECDKSPCKNGGKCTNKYGKYTCTCPSGWTGKDCETDVDECLTSPCKNGATCVNNDGGYQCQCGAGWTGDQCEKDVDECNSSPCQNAGSCENTDGAYTCKCDAGYGGKHCEQVLDQCKQNPCQNGGTCDNKDGGYSCSCLPQWSGKDCDEDVNECELFPCQNGGTCRNTAGGYVCECMPGWEGKDCEHDIDECASHYCQNGATCVNDMAGYRCICPAGFEGFYCSEVQSMPTPAIRGDYEPVGCFHDSAVEPRPLPELLGNFRSELDWQNVKSVVDKCAELAKEKGYKFFAIQYYGECWSGPNAGSTYARDGKAKNCFKGVDKNTMFLFALIAVWIISVASEEIRSGEYLTLQKKTFYEVPGTRVALHGYFKFCNPKTCASCFRVMYVKIGDHIICLGRRYLRYIKNCKEYSFTADAIVPKNDGKYKIMWYSPFQYGCGTIPKGERGVKVGTIHVGNPLFWIVGKNSFTAAPGDIIWVNGCYRYCKTEKLFCPNYVRQVYFNAGAGSSECAASYIADQDFVCEGKCVKRSVKVPEKPGNYSIRESSQPGLQIVEKLATPLMMEKVLDRS